MYLYELKIIKNGEELYEDVWADNGRDALEIGEMMYPEADVYVL